jgi:hypothetical protein
MKPFNRYPYAPAPPSPLPDASLDGLFCSASCSSSLSSTSSVFPRSPAAAVLRNPGGGERQVGARRAF